MARRLRFYDLRTSRLPSLVGLCAKDSVQVAEYVNSAQQRLLTCREAGEESWLGTWAEIAFNVSRTNPYFTAPREVARLEVATVCDRPIPIQNQFYEYLQFGNGRMPKRFRSGCLDRERQVYSRNNTPTFVDLTNPPQIIAVYTTDPADNDGTKRVLVQGVDSNGSVIYSQDGTSQVQGIFLTLTTPFASSPMSLNQITGFQKDITSGPIQIFQVDPVTGAQTLLLTMQPSEQTAWYRRYYFDHMPCGCCPPPGIVPAGLCDPVQVTAIVKLDLIPVKADTDYCLLQNAEAIIEECQSIRYAQIDTPAAIQLSQWHHTQAVRFLNGELTHVFGSQTPAINFAPFGSARLRRKQIGRML